MPCVNRKSIQSKDLQNPKPVTLSDIKAVPELSDNLNNFFGITELREGIDFFHALKGARLDPANCWSFTDPKIDLSSCRATKPAGSSHMRIHKSRLEMFVDTDVESVKTPVPLWSVCSDGDKILRLKFLYHKTFYGITAGPWMYTVEVRKKGKETVVSTTALDLVTQKSILMDAGKVAVVGTRVTGADMDMNTEKTSQARTPVQSAEATQ
jgi:hypothetical protein